MLEGARYPDQRVLSGVLAEFGKVNIFGKNLLVITSIQY